MKPLTVICLFFYFVNGMAQSGITDTIIDLGGYGIHFNIIEGSGIPILFESGAGDDGTVWNNILPDIYALTGTTLITYDRAGFGKSEINPDAIPGEIYSISDNIEALETGLKVLGYFEDIIIVSHSYGGFYSTLYASRNPEKVRYNIRVDANLVGWYTDEILEKIEAENPPPKTDSTLGIYLLVKNYGPTVRFMRTVKFPRTVPVIDIWSPIQRHHTDREWKLLVETHNNFVNAASNREAIVAKHSGHYIHVDNPDLVIYAILKAYIKALDDTDQKLDILSKVMDKALNDAASKP